MNHNVIHVNSICFRRCEKGIDGKMKLIPTEMGTVKDKNEKIVGVSFRIQACMNFHVVNPNVPHGGMLCFCYHNDLTKIEWIGMRVISVHPQGKCCTCEPVLGNPETDLFPHFEMTFALEESAKSLKFLSEHHPEQLQSIVGDMIEETTLKWLSGDYRFKSAGLELIENATRKNVMLGQDILHRVGLAIGPNMRTGDFHRMVKSIQIKVKDLRNSLRREQDPTEEDMINLEDWAKHNA